MSNQRIFGASSPAAPSALIQSTTLNLSSAQILTLNTVPVQILPAPGAGKVYRIIAFQWNFIAGSVAYTIVGLTSIQLADNALAATLITIAPANTGLTNAAGTNSQAGNIGGAMTITPSSKVINKPLIVVAFGANPAAGNGTAICTVEWYIANLS